MDANLRQRFANQLSRGEVVLFTGAGFSRAARGRSGEPIPSVQELKTLLWPVAFPGEPMDDRSSLGDTYHCAVKTAGNRTGDLLKSRLSVDSSSLPDVYKLWFSMPWYRIYTLNVDDLDAVVQLIFQVPRKIRSVSALNESLPPGDELLSIHLNGRIADYPEMTFSPPQYGERTARPDPWYSHLLADLAGHPILFVGTELDEPPLWHHMELRRTRTPGVRELRPGSYIVTPNLAVARRGLLRDFNIALVEMKQEEFAAEVLANLQQEKEKGLQVHISRASGFGSGRLFQRVGELRNQPADLAGEFLLGCEPTWGDIITGTAVEREFERGLRDQVSQSRDPLVILTGTAGSGKSTTLMRLALAYHAEGKDVIWVNASSDLPFGAIRTQLRNSRAEVIAIDDVDNFGSSTGSFLAEIVSVLPNSLLLVAMRTTRLDTLDVESYLGKVEHLTFSIPHLGDSDIDLLLDALTKAARLGKLRGLGRHQQVDAFRKQAGRQLLVAMIQATANETFEEKIDSECRELNGGQKLAYSILALATSLRTPLTRDEVLLAVGDPSNESLVWIERLQAQRLVIDDGQGQLRVRHRVIADRVLDHLRAEGQLVEPLQGLLWAIATKTGPGLPKQSRENRLLRRLMSHDFMINITDDRETPRRAYESVEALLSWDYHYFLQRGSYEVEVGNLDLAKNFLDQARGMAPDDYMVQTEWAYMTLKRATLNAGSVWARDHVAEAFAELEEAIGRRGQNDSYPYHVLGSQGLSWVRRAVMSKDEKAQELTRLAKIVEDGCSHHPKEKDLQQLLADLRKECLMLAVPAGQNQSKATT